VVDMDFDGSEEFTQLHFDTYNIENPELESSIVVIYINKNNPDFFAVIVVVMAKRYIAGIILFLK